jgi:hypothetical protein
MKIEKTETQVWKVNNQIVHTHFLSDTRQLFETEEGSYVYFLDEDKLIKLDTDKYTLLLIKLLRFLELADEEIENKK